MNPLALRFLLLTAAATLGLALTSAPASTPAALTLTETSSVCEYGCSGAIPVATAWAIANASDAPAADKIITGLTSLGGTTASTSVANATTVTTTVSATNCPPGPSLNAIINQSLNHLGRGNSSDNNETSPALAEQPMASPPERWSTRSSLCFTSSSFVMAGYYWIYLDGWGYEDNCAGGVLDNIRGHCGSVVGWGCRSWGGGQGVLIQFSLPGPKYAKCALDGIWDASPPDTREEGLCCLYVGMPWATANTC